MLFVDKTCIEFLDGNWYTEITLAMFSTDEKKLLRRGNLVLPFLSFMLVSLLGIVCALQKVQ